MAHDIEIAQYCRHVSGALPPQTMKRPLWRGGAFRWVLLPSYKLYDLPCNSPQFIAHLDKRIVDCLMLKIKFRLPALFPLEI